MSSPSSQNGSETEDAQKSSGQVQTAVTETTECANCGRTFVGDYCPNCGQEADPSTSPAEVVGGLFRELVDLEQGFWATFVGLTLRPGTTLAAYLRGARKALVTPGRYLAGALVVVFGTNRLLKVLVEGGALLGSPRPLGPDHQVWDWSEQSVTGARSVVDYWLKEATGRYLVVMYLLVALVVGLLLWRLFRDEIGSVGEGLALSGFLTGHLGLLNAGVWLGILGTSGLFQYDLRLAVIPGLLFHIGASAVYLGLALYLCFGQRWQTYVLGLFIGWWGWAEGAMIVQVGKRLIAFLLVEAYGTSQEPFFTGKIVVFLLVPLCAHGAVELYNVFFR